jgi:RNA ligase (TIGR02306 family)
VRTLVSRQVIADVAPIVGADAIEKVRVNGWWVVAKKGEFRPNDECWYCEIDSVLPCVPEFEFLRKGCHIKRDWLPEGEGFRLRTIKLRGQVSQGLVVKDLSDSDAIISRTVKYAPPVPAALAGLARGNWPEFLSKTDQERCQNLVAAISKNTDNEKMFEVTIKLDGSSCTFAMKDGDFYVCSRNVNLKADQEGNAFVDIARKLGVEEKLRQHARNIAIQGELMGPGIQGNRERLSSTTFFVFDIFDIDEQRYLPPDERRDIASQMGLSHCPVVSTSMLLPAGGVQDILSMADGPSLSNPVREGLVFKRMDGSFSFKAISNQFLLLEK